MENLTRDFYKNKRVLVTGHTGFKGAWMCAVLNELGADVTGYALEPPTSPSLFELSKMKDKVNSIIGDVRDLEHLKKVFDKVRPEIVIHMAAQPIVRESYKNPVATFEINVMGTVNILECIRLIDSVKSFVNVTTDKVYKNLEREEGYTEDDELNGFDPYSNSKSCSELVTSSYQNSFFADRQVAISTVRAGNVIGGGDFATDRIIPDCFRALSQGREIVVRNPYSTRPYQHVLEAVCAYLMIAQRQYEDIKYAGNYNIGPDEESCLTTGTIVTKFCELWKDMIGDNFGWRIEGDGGPHEANFLKLDCSKAKKVFGWSPVWTSDNMLTMTIEWMQNYLSGADIYSTLQKQIGKYINE